MRFRSRGWLNFGFWLIWASCLGWVLSHSKSSDLQGQISLFLASAALWLNLFPRFLQGPKLSCAFSQITILGLSSGNQEPMIVEIALDDLLSEKPSPQASNLMNSVPVIAYSVLAKQRPELLKLFSQTHPTRYGYVPSDEIIISHLRDPRTTPNFFVPVVVHNSGGALGNVASIVMTMQLVGPDHRKWAYAAYLEVDPKAIIDPRKQIKDTDIFAGFFPGCAVRPSEGVRLNLHFTLHHNAGALQSSLVPGDYDISVLGFDARGKPMFRTKPVRYPLKQESLLVSFKGSQWTYYANMEEHIAEALR